MSMEKAQISRAGAKTLAPIETVLQTAWKHRFLIQELVARDLRGAHAAHGLGHLWVYLQPLVTVVTFMLIFGVVIGSKITVSTAFPGDYISYILCGLVPWLLTANALGRAPSVFMSNANLVKQVVFPVETLPIASTLGCFMTFAPAFAVMLGYQLIVGSALHLTLLLLPLVVLLHACFILGLMFIFSVLTPFLRDIRELVTVYSSVSMYFTPAIYLPDWVPELVRPLLYLNPFSYVVWVYQDALFYGRVQHGFAWIVFLALALASLALGVAGFRRVKPFLGNVL